MAVLAVCGAVGSLIAATVEGIVILPRPNLPIIGENLPIGALPVAAFLAFGVRP